MSISSTAVLIADMVAHTQGIIDAATKIELLFELAAEKQNNDHFNRVLFMDAQDNLGAVIKLEDKLYRYSELLRSSAGISINDGKTIEQLRSRRETDRGDR